MNPITTAYIFTQEMSNYIPYFESMITKNIGESGCWMWMGNCTRDGYGIFHIKGKTITAHRYSYLMKYGTLEQNHIPHHTCHNPWCVRPDHLESVTMRENILRDNPYIAAKAAQTACVHGHPFTPENTGRDGRGSRYCKTCHRRRAKQQKEPVVGQAPGQEGVMGTPIQL